MEKEYEITGNVFIDLHTMHMKYGFHDKKLTKQELRQRIDFLQEELDELKEAFDNKDSESIVDALIDIKVVASGTLDLAKVDGEMAWQEVMSANMKKEVGFNPKRPNSDGHDLIKPEGWKAPNHSNNLGILPEVLNQNYNFQYFPKAGDTYKERPQTFYVNKKLKIQRDPCTETEIRAARWELSKLCHGFTFNDAEHPEVMQIIRNVDYWLTNIQSEQQKAIKFKFETKTILSENKRRFAIDFLENCKEFMLKKAADYNNEMSSVRSADYYLRGADDMLFNIREKYLRITSVLDIMKAGGEPNFDSLQDSFRDLAIFAAMFAEWCAGKMDGQDISRDIFNRPILRGEHE